jgi:hypothetical protein
MHQLVSRQNHWKSSRTRSRRNRERRRYARHVLLLGQKHGELPIPKRTRNYVPGTERSTGNNGMPKLSFAITKSCRKTPREFGSSGVSGYKLPRESLLIAQRDMAEEVHLLVRKRKSGGYRSSIPSVSIAVNRRSRSITSSPFLGAVRENSKTSLLLAGNVMHAKTIETYEEFC